MGRLFVIGSLNVDSIIPVARHPRPGETVFGGDPARHWGGKGANQAVAAARAAGADAARIVFIGRVGEDADGQAYRERLASLGIDVNDLRSTPGVPTGSAVIAVSETGENTIIVASAANARLVPDDLDALDGLRPEDVVVLTLEVPPSVVQRAAERTAGAGARLVLNLSPVIELPEEIVRLADPLVVNEHEALEVEQRYGRLASVLVTSGAGGSDWNGVHVPARADVEVVDTTGAGDAYCGALAFALAQGADAETAMRTATDAAAEIVGRPGAQ